MKILSKRFTLQRSDDLVPSSADGAYEEYGDLDRPSDNIPADVKEEHFVVYAETQKKKFVVPLAYLSQSLFQDLLSMAKEEFGFDHPMGGLTIPCSEEIFISVTSNMSIS
ncbi:Auxin-induced protein 15A [Linum perenne]